jgi:hypothetical protein
MANATSNSGLFGLTILFWLKLTFLPLCSGGCYYGQCDARLTFRAWIPTGDEDLIMRNDLVASIASGVGGMPTIPRDEDSTPTRLLLCRAGQEPETVLAVLRGMESHSRTEHLIYIK